MKSTPLDDILSHWSKLYEGLEASSEHFYDSVKEGLKRRRLPDARVKRVHWSESGVLSPNRIYLRIEGSGFRFDLCAAPFGTGFFFSWWLTRKPAERVGLYLLLFIVGSGMIFRALVGVVQGLFRESSPLDLTVMVLRFLVLNPITIGAVSILSVMVLVSALSRSGWSEPEDATLAVPILGWVYEHIFSPITYYQLDTAIMFRTTVHQSVLEALDALTTQKGLRALAPEERKPTLDRLG